MNKLYLPLLLVLLALASCSKDSEPEPVSEPEPESYLKSVTAYMTPFQNGSPAPGARFKWTSESYTREGLLYKKEYRVSERPQEMHNSLMWENFTYQNGLLIARSIFVTPHAVVSNGFNGRYAYSYSSGKLSELKYYSTGGLLFTDTYEYNNGDIPARMVKIYSDSEWPYHYSYTYDNRGNLTKQEIKVADLGETRYWEYDEKNNLTKQSFSPSWDETMFVVETFNYTYDTKGRIAEREFSKNGMQRFQKWIYHYDDSNQEHPDRIKSIDVYEETAPSNRIYEQVGVIDYEYEYGTI